MYLKWPSRIFCWWNWSSFAIFPGLVHGSVILDVIRTLLRNNVRLYNNRWWTLISNPLLFEIFSFLFEFVCKLVWYVNQLRIWVETGVKCFNSYIFELVFLKANWLRHANVLVTLCFNEIVQILLNIRIHDLSVTLCWHIWVWLSFCHQCV